MTVKKVRRAIGTGIMTIKMLDEGVGMMTIHKLKTGIETETMRTKATKEDRRVTTMKRLRRGIGIDFCLAQMQEGMKAVVLMNLKGENQQVCISSVTEVPPRGFSGQFNQSEGGTYKERMTHGVCPRIRWLIRVLHGLRHHG
jgi:hypothetical protein